MKIKPVILCGGSGTRLNFKKNKNLPKQFIDFGNWTLFGKTLDRVKSSIFDAPIISTNNKYLKQVKQHLKKHRINKYKIVLEPSKRNTAPAILSSALIKDIPDDQPLIFLAADHLIENVNIFNKAIKKNQKNLNKDNIFIFGIKPTKPSSEFGYFLTKKTKNNINKVSRFVEKPKEVKAKQIIKKKGYWNSGMILARKDSIINNFIKYQSKTLNLCIEALNKSKCFKNVHYLNKKTFKKIQEKSFDYAILEKSKNINGIKLNISLTDLGNWKEIWKFFKKIRSKNYIKRNTFFRPWGKYINLFSGKGFLLKEMLSCPPQSSALSNNFSPYSFRLCVNAIA